jgi:hypothetical protein
MYRILIFLTALALGVPMNSSPATQHFPTFAAKDLAGTALTLPKDLPGDRTILLVAFERHQQDDIDTWTQGMHLLGSKLAWLELPVIQNPGAFMRWFIDGGMRRGITDHEIWKHVVTLYIDKAAFKKAVGIESEKTVYALVVDRQGHVLATVTGDYSEAGAAKLLDAIHQEPR